VKKRVSALVVALAATALSVAFGAAPPPKKPIVQVHMTFRSGYVYDLDYVVTTGAILGYKSATGPGGSDAPVLATFYRGNPSRQAIATLQAQISALNPSSLPSACTHDSGPFIDGTEEVHLYNLPGATSQEIVVTVDHTPSQPADCPDTVLSLLDDLGTFFTRNARPIS